MPRLLPTADKPTSNRWLRSAGTQRQTVIALAENIYILKGCGCAEEALQLEHDAIESVLESLWDAVLGGASRADVIEILNLAIDFCATHFADEEEIMRERSYVHLEAHIASHKRLLTEFVAARRSASGDGLSLAVLDVAELLDSFHLHVNTHDLEFEHPELEPDQKNGSPS